jgi:hypothetical protein
MTDGGRRGDSKYRSAAAIAQLGAGESARGLEADRHVKLAPFAVEGSLSGAYSHRDEARWDSSPLCWSMTCPITIRHSSSRTGERTHSLKFSDLCSVIS